MTLRQSRWLAIVRIAMGWMYLYAGLSKVFHPGWSAAGYLKGAKSAVWLFEALQAPSVLPLVNFVNMWGLTLLGVSLLLGIGLRVSTKCGVALMALYYLPILSFPFVGATALLIDEHVIYASMLVLLGVLDAGKTWGLAHLEPKWLKSTS